MKNPLLLFHHGAFNKFDGKKYKMLSDADFRAEIVNFCKTEPELVDRISPSLVKGIQGVVESVCHIDSGIEMPAWIGEGTIPAPDLVVFDNGLLDIRKAIIGDPDALRPHTPDLFTRIALPYCYVPNAECTRWLAVLNEIIADPDARKLLQQWFGYNLVADTSRHAFLLMVGRGANGKSVVCKILVALLGQENVSTLTLERLAGRFDLYQTYGKLANIAPEIGDLDRPVEAMLKSFVAGDPVTFERKYKDTFSARPTARMTFATNNPPRFSDRSEGLWRRMLLLPFDVAIPPNRQDPHLVDRLQAELPGILNWALAGLRELNEQGHFTEPAKSMEAKEQYRQDVNSARAFLSEEVQASPNFEIETKRLYRAYAKWCEERNFRAFGDNIFGKEVKNLFPNTQKQLRRSQRNPNRHRVYVGITLIEQSLGDDYGRF